MGGISAAFVLIPQALAYAVLAGMPAERGLHVAALAPIAAAFFASSPYLGTGPTAITSLLTLGGLTALARPGGAEFVALGALLALLVGAARVALGLLHLGVASYLISRPVLTGFTSGAAVVITASQIPTVLDVPAHHPNPFLAAFHALGQPAEWRPAAIAMAVVIAALMAGGRRIHRLFPTVLVAIVLAIAWTAVVGYDGSVVGDIRGGFPTLSLDLPWGSAHHLVLPALVIAVIGFAEPAAIARHYATMERTPWNPDRELVSQGMANLAAGIGGGFPAGGSFTRSALVRDAGARTRLAGGITGGVVLLLLPFTAALGHLPTAVLAATIIMAVRSLMTVTPFVEYRRYSRLQFRIAVVTFGLTIAMAPHVERAVIAGVGLAIGAHLWRELRVSIKTWTEGTTLHLAPKGVLYFASAPLLEERLGRMLSETPSAQQLVVHLGGLGRIDVSGALGLRSMLEEAEEAGLDATICDVPPQARKIVRRVLEGQHGS
ncbi:MAG: SulP family inorganic anion transporter [Acidimicrobiia bacterium]